MPDNHSQNKKIPATQEIVATAAPSSARDGGRSTIDDGKPIAGHIVIPEAPDVAVRYARPILADLAGRGRIGLGTLVAPADPVVILDGFGYRLDPVMSASPVSPAARLRSATVVDSEHRHRFPLDERARLVDIARLPAHVFGVAPPIVAMQLSGSFSRVTAPNGIFGRTQGTAVGFMTHVSRSPEWHLAFLTSDRTLGGPVRDISIEDAELTIWIPSTVYQARPGVEGHDTPRTAQSGC